MQVTVLATYYNLKKIQRKEAKLHECERQIYHTANEKEGIHGTADVCKKQAAW